MWSMTMARFCRPYLHSYPPLKRFPHFLNLAGFARQVRRMAVNLKSWTDHHAPIRLCNRSLMTPPPAPPKAPLDATIVTLQAGDVLPGHELETEPVLDYGEASADEAGDSARRPLAHSPPLPGRQVRPLSVHLNTIRH